MMSALAQPFVSLKTWLTREDELATPSPVADENHFTTRQDYNRFLFGVGAILQTERDWLLKAEYRGLFGNSDQDEHSFMLNIEKQF